MVDAGAQQARRIVRHRPKLLFGGLIQRLYGALGRCGSIARLVRGAHSRQRLIHALFQIRLLGGVLLGGLGIIWLRCCVGHLARAVGLTRLCLPLGGVGCVGTGGAVLAIRLRRGRLAGFRPLGVLGVAGLLIIVLRALLVRL